MNKLKLLIVASFFLLPFAARADNYITLFGQGDMKTMFNWEVPRDRFESLPRWTPSSGVPPLPISRAIEIATGWIKARNPKIDGFEVSTITLAVSHSWTDDQPNDRWYYKIEFNPVVNGKMLYGGQYTAVVLFDGTVVEPRADTRSR